MSEVFTSLPFYMVCRFCWFLPWFSNKYKILEIFPNNKFNFNFYISKTWKSKWPSVVAKDFPHPSYMLYTIHCFSRDCYIKIKQEIIPNRQDHYIVHARETCMLLCTLPFFWLYEPYVIPQFNLKVHKPSATVLNTLLLLWKKCR